MRLSVKKTYKLYINGQFPRTESEHYYAVRARNKDDSGQGGPLLANVCKGSRKDVRNAVVAARAAQAKWQKLSALNRGQILYRCAEILEARARELAGELAQMGQSARAARTEVDAAIDCFVHYAGFTDKLGALLGSVNPVAGPYFNFTFPEPMGVVGLVAPEKPPLLGLVERLLPIIASGNSVVALTSEKFPLAALTLGEVLQNGDLPAGVVNLISGPKLSLVEGLAAHMDVNAIELGGVEDATIRAQAERAAAENLKRVVSSDTPIKNTLAAIKSFVECKTVWHPLAL